MRKLCVIIKGIIKKQCNSDIQRLPFFITLPSLAISTLPSPPPLSLSPPSLLHHPLSTLPSSPSSFSTVLSPPSPLNPPPSTFPSPPSLLHPPLSLSTLPSPHSTLPSPTSPLRPPLSLSALPSPSDSLTIHLLIYTYSTMSPFPPPLLQFFLGIEHNYVRNVVCGGGGGGGGGVRMVCTLQICGMRTVSNDRMTHNHVKPVCTGTIALNLTT